MHGSGPLPVGSNFIGQVGMAGTVINRVLTLDTGAYADKDLMSDTIELENVARVPLGRTWLVYVHVLDEADQAGAFDIVFLDEFVTLGSLNSAPSISDANARKIVGKCSVPSAAYLDIGGSGIATITPGTTDGNLPLLMQTGPLTRSLFMATIARGTPTYAVNSLRLKLGFSWD